ncbi:MAG: DNA replication/repair protein RecF [Candidatus Fimenecus sp.]
MVISSLKIKDFRNYENAEIKFDEKLNIILGENGQGKTSILEAIYINSFGKSFRASHDKEMVKFGKKGFYSQILIHNEDEKEKIEIFFENGKKIIKINENPIKKLSELLNCLHIVAFSPEDLKIVKEDPQKRRNFMDISLCKMKPLYFAALSNYKKILIQKNILLKEEYPNREMLEIWNLELAKYGTKIIKERYEFIKKIAIIAGNIQEKISDSKEKLEINYVTNVFKQIDLKENEDLEKNFFKKLCEQIENEIEKRTCILGPHRDDIDIIVNGVNMRKYGSQGQQKTAALALKFSEIEIMKKEFSEECILILDDVLSELDESRQKYLIESFKNVQIFISATEISNELKEFLSYGKKIYIKKGEVEKIV